ncbi:HEPN domain-containing protein [Fluviibacter phosphoraccumulans]|uniref:Uncharacterized protein n=1 Tax=Fluviibacter phosphoraccumulans TaxID=1751046 RepID=A0A679I8W8_9RHOO|nr:HEPN domain-containing protein [Fluviibacter phosphoraccumulans]BBU69324.1 hypothetical protein ICHIAU1_16070 [Fluviibacter phosphoraccumulans]BCA65259.1 hypothetical protein SHINM1_008610 [Fluviibacter phosphoraccumulans]
MVTLKHRDVLINYVEDAVEKFTTLYLEKCEDGFPQDVAKKICLHEVSSAVIAKLEDERELQSSVSRMIQSENGSSSFNPNVIAQKLINKGFVTGSGEIAVSWLEKVLDTKQAAGISVMAIWGVRVDRAVRLGNRVLLVPINELPDSYQKRWLLETDWLQSKVNSVSSPFMEAPTAALMVDAVVEPLFIDIGNNTKPNNTWELNQELLDDARLGLSMLGPCAPLQAYSWFNFVDSDIAEAQLGAARSSTHIEIMPLRIAESGPLDVDLASSLVGKYLSLEGNDKQRLKLALDRLNQGLRRFKPGDQAMEISIALETLLADGGTENTYKIGLRAAILLGGDGEAMLRNRAIVGGAYVMRSALVHSGAVPTEIKVPRLGKLPACEVARRAASICSPH